MLTTSAEAYAEKVKKALEKAGLRAVLDVRNDKINAKVRDHSLQKIPVILVVGNKEVDQETVALRRLGGEAQEILSLYDAIESLVKESSPPDLRTWAN